MRGFTLLGKEFTEIIKSKKILIPIIAVLFVPLLYAGMFLWAFWDPYEQLDDLPVAVVNLDKGAVFDGKPIEVGKGLVDELKDNKSFKWEFVSEKTAKEGMENRKYYMLVRIPENFSDNATTLLKKNPRPLNLEYIPNESLNFLSSQIGGTAIEKIKGEVSNTLTKTYAEKMFDSIKDVSQGFADAKDGANKLHDGAGELQDGSSKVTDGINQLSEKANSGFNRLASGSRELTDGLGKLNSEVSRMPGGVNQLLAGSSKITDGLGKLNSEVSGMPSGVNQLLAGSQQITKGLNQFTDSQGDFQVGLKQSAKGSEQLHEKLKELSAGTEKTQKGISTLDEGLNQSLASIINMENKLPELTKGTKDLSVKSSQFSQGVSEWKKQADTLSSVANETAGGAQQVSNGLGELNKKIEDLPEEYRKQLQPVIQGIIEGNQKVSKGTVGVAQGVQKLAGEAGAGKIEAGATEISDGANKISKEQLSLETGISSLKEGQQMFVNGADELAKGSLQLVEGTKQLTVRADQLNTGLGQILEKSTAGLNKLANGSNEVTGGLNTLASKSGQLTSGVSALLDGSGQVTGGLNTLASKSGQLTNGVGALLDGSQQITGGLGQLVDPKGEFQGGFARLQDGSGKVTDGLVKVNDGSGELATKLGEGAEKTSEVKGTDKTYNMFADPVKVQTEKMSEVPNYGTGFTPYFLSLGLFVGALLLSIVYPLRDTVGVPKSGFSWFISKFGVLLSVGIIQALVADLVLLLGLGVEVQSVPYYILFSILTSLAFIALIQCLVTAFGDAGRFIAILTLIMQLTTSAGTFPLELIPKFLQHFNAWLPMTYSVSGFKAVVSSGDFGFMWQNAGILMIFIVLLSLGTIGSLTWMHKRQFRNLVEEKSIEA
ncbi:phage infection protein [Bacillus pseudomycoides]|uniref:YhgE/Pip domain-containing protein n=1 Tax=Bacillus pseudomycoides TaxID=64104 RepID=UPI000BF63742|nr:YhgE/Pip domain-containing protein [Bacillus pseudomycoides]PGC24387.1 phage infection protein [Bacillus pseudomycoides]